MDIDPRFSAESGREVMTGSELLLKGAMEAAGGIGLLTGCPAPPVAGFFDACLTLGAMLRERGVVTRFGSDAAQAVASLRGGVLAGGRGVAVFSGQGLQAGGHVLGEASALGVSGEAAAVVVVGDDTWGDTARLTDSRPLFQHLNIPLLEPSDAQETKDWVSAAARLSAATGGYIGLRLDGTLAEGGGSVEVKRNETFKAPDTRAGGESPSVGEPELRRRAARACSEARRWGINSIENKPHKGEDATLGFVAAGAAYGALAHALEEMGLSGRLPILKLGMVWPLDEELLREFSSQVSQVVVVEAGRPFVEPMARAVLGPLSQAGLIQTQVWGKLFLRELLGIGESAILHPSHLIERLVPLVKQHPTLPVELTNGRLTSELERIEHAAAARVELPNRTPSFCPGCPQRETSGVLRQLRDDLRDPAYMQRMHRLPPVDLVIHGEEGCSSLASEPPHNGLVSAGSLAAGRGGGVAEASSLWTGGKQVVLMGDDTFLGGGIEGVRHSIASKQDVTYLVTANQTTGTRPRAGHTGNEESRRGRKAPPGTAMERVELALRQVMGGRRREGVRVVRMNPEDREEFRDALEKAVLAGGVKIVIADKACALEPVAVTAPRDEPSIQTMMRVVEDVCEHCLECTRTTGCPSLDIVETDYGPKVQTNPTTCEDDGACARIQVCPAFERVTVVRTQPPARPDDVFDVRVLPDPPRPVHAERDVWRCALAGVGGMGVRSLTWVVISAGWEMGYHVQYMLRKGKAFRGGSVYGQAVFTRDVRRAASGPIPCGKADLLLALDPLEGAACVDGAGPYRVASPDVTAAVVNSSVAPTVESLVEGRRLDGGAMCHAIARRSLADGCFTSDLSAASTRFLGHGRYVNTLMLGVAFQHGYLPVTLEAIERSIRRIFRDDAGINLRAFRLGRGIAADPERFGVGVERGEESPLSALRRKRGEIAEHFGGRRGRRLGLEYLRLMRECRSALRSARVDRSLARDFAIRVADCVVWDGRIEYGRRYARRVLGVLVNDSPERGHAATRAVVWNLARVMLMKDEVYVASMLSSPGKRRGDRERLNIDPTRGDRVVYHRYHRPQISLFGLRHSFAWRSRDWQLRLLARSRWLRVLPGWGKRDRRFREWYERLVDQAGWADEPRYRKWVAALGVPQQATGFRDVRWAKLDAARLAAEAALNTPDDTPPTPGPRIRISLSDRVLVSTRD